MAPESTEEARRPCTTAGIWHFMYDANLKIADVWFLRELSTDEFYRKASYPLCNNLSSVSNGSRHSTMAQQETESNHAAVQLLFRGPG